MKQRNELVEYAKAVIVLCTMSFGSFVVVGILNWVTQ